MILLENHTSRLPYLWLFTSFFCIHVIMIQERNKKLRHKKLCADAHYAILSL